MFERYTERARRIIFWARYEASQYGSPYIEGEYILLGILREDGPIVAMLPAGAAQKIRAQVDARTKRPKKNIHQRRFAPFDVFQTNPC
jgi:ATP-dependent Clp protease ATP-binding subunit ClpC